MDFDLPGLDTKALSEQGVDMPVRLLNGTPMTNKDGKPVTIRLLGPDSAKYRAMTREQVRLRVQRAADAQGRGEKPEASAEEDEAAALDILVACTLGWSGLKDKGGADVPFSADAARQLYTNFPAIRDQVDYFVAQRVNFTTASSKA